MPKPKHSNHEPHDPRKPREEPHGHGGAPREEPHGHGGAPYEDPDYDKPTEHPHEPPENARYPESAYYDAPMCCQDVVAGLSGRPVMGHSGEGRLL
jgi:hypothetical protein